MRRRATRGRPAGTVLLGLALCAAVAGTRAADAPAAHASDSPAAAADPLYQRAEHDYRQTLQQAREREARAAAARDHARALLDQAKQDLAKEQRRSEALKQAFTDNTAARKRLHEELARRSASLKSFFDAVRESAADVHGMLEQSLIAAQYPDGKAVAARLTAASVNPSIADVGQLWSVMQRELRASGRTARFTAPVTRADHTGAPQTVTRVGTFDALAGGRFLHYQPETGRLAVPAVPPTAAARAGITAFDSAAGGYHRVAVDPSGGADLPQILSARDASERMREGHMAGYAALVLGVAGMLAPLTTGWARRPGAFSGAALVTFGVFILLTSLFNLFVADVTPLPRYQEVAFVDLKQPRPETTKTAQVLPQLKPPPQALDKPTPRPPVPPAPVMPAPPLLTAPVGATADTAVQLSGAPVIGKVGAAPLQLDNEAIPVVQIPPVYPMRAQRLRLHGTVVVQFTIDEVGRVQDPRIIRSDPPEVFDQAVVRAILQWRFKPKLEDGKPIARLARQRFTFAPSNQR